MINSLDLYIEAIKVVNTARNNNPSVEAVPILKSYYLQLTTMTFYELMTKKTSPLISTLCQVNNIGFQAKNFSFMPAQVSFNLYTSFDLYVIVYGLNVALAENLDSCLNVFESNGNRIFRSVVLPPEGFQSLLMNLQALDESLGKFRNVERIVEKRVEVPVEKIVEKRIEVPIQSPPQNFSDEQDKDFLQSLKTLADNRHSEDEKIIDEVKKVQLALQDELPRLQGTLKTILDIRDEIDFKTMEEPIRQLIRLLDKLNETLQRHPQADTQKGYDMLLKRCNVFLRFIEQALAMLGTKFINETNIPFDPDKHEVTNTSSPSAQARVSKVLRVGLTYKGQVLRKAEVEITEPVLRGTSASEYYANYRQPSGGNF